MNRRASKRQGCRGRTLSRGAGSTELLLALPLLLLLGLALLQFALLFHAYHALSYALFEGARAASVQRAREAPTLIGLARGLAPFNLLYLSEPPNQTNPEQALAQAHRSILWGQTQGWIELRRLSPTPASFDDWARPERDDNGHPVSGPPVISSEQLQYRRYSEVPRSGVLLVHNGEPVGSASLQTLSDANLLKLELRFGARLIVPIVGQFMVWLMRQADACDPVAARTIGLLRFDNPAGPRQTEQGTASWRCPFYLGRDQHGQAQPRWPLRMSATIRMQSPIEPL